MKLISNSLTDGQPVPGEFAFCIPDPEHHVCLGRNLNPHLAWREAPAGTRSFAIICHDPDVPSKGDDVNQEGRTVPASLPASTSSIGFCLTYRRRLVRSPRAASRAK